MSEPALIESRGVSCERVLCREDRSRVKNLSIAVAEDSLTVVRGAEACGKNLFLRLLGFMERPDRGEIEWRGRPTRKWTDDELAAKRLRHFGYVFTAPFLLSSFSVVENVAMPALKRPEEQAEGAALKAARVLDLVGLSEVAEWPVSELTLAEQQRVSLARALVNRPDVLVVENVDFHLGEAEAADFAELLCRLQGELGLTVIASVTGGMFRECAGRILEMEGGVLRSDSSPVPIRSEARA